MSNATSGRTAWAATVLAAAAVGLAGCAGEGGYQPPPGGNGGYQSTSSPTSSPSEPVDTPTGQPPDATPSTSSSSDASPGTPSAPPSNDEDAVHRDGTPRHAALEWVEAYHSASHRDEGPTDWMERVAALSTDQLAGTYETRVQQIEARPGRAAAEWEQLVETKRDQRVTDAQAKCVQDGRTEDTCLVEIRYTLTTSTHEGGDSETDRIRSLLVKQVDGVWLVDREQQLAD